MFRSKTRAICRLAPLALLASLSLHAQTQTPPLTPLTVQLDWKPTAQFAGILVAKQQGYYAAEGLGVTIRTGGDTPTVAIVASHASDPAAWIGIAEADLLLDANAKGTPIKAFATMLQSSPFALLTLRDSGLTTIRSLKGKTIGLHDDGQKAIDVLLQFNGMTRSDITTTSIPYDFAPLLTGKVAAMQGYIIDEPIRLRMEHHPVDIIPMSANGYTCYAEVLFTSTTILHSHPDTLARFLRATAKGWRYAAAHPEATARMIVAKYAPDSSVAEQRASLMAVIPLLTTENPHFGMMQPTTWTKSIQMFETYKLVDRKLNAVEAVDYSILNRLYPGKTHK